MSVPPEVHLKEQGFSKAAIAEKLGKSGRYVQKWWQLGYAAIPRPPGVHEWLNFDSFRDVEVGAGWAR